MNLPGSEGSYNGSIRATVNIMPDGPASTVAALASTAEDLGFDACWIFDEGLVTRDVYVTLTAVALATSKLRIGTGITNPYTRHPGATAAAIASLDELSGGRAFIGLGAGGGLTLTPLAIPRTKPLLAVREMVETLRALFSGETVNYSGTTVQLTEASLEFARPDIEIWVAGRGPKMLTQAGAIADGVHLSYIHKSTIGDSVARIRSGGGDQRPKLSLATALVTNDIQLAQARVQLTFRLIDSPEAVKAMLKLTEADIAALREALAAGGPPAAAHLVKEDWVSQFTIMGSPRDCGRELRSIMSTHQIDEFQVPILDLEHAEMTLATATAVLD